MQLRNSTLSLIFEKWEKHGKLTGGNEFTVKSECTGLGKRVVPRLRESRLLTPSGRGT